MQNTFQLGVLFRLAFYLIFMRCIGANIIIQTIDETKDNLKLSDNGAFSMADSSLIFQVYGCDNAFIKLHASSSLVGPNYNIIIGGWGNTRSQISKTVTTEQLLDLYYYNHLMDCYSFQNFWISWQKGMIRVGSGNTLNYNVFLLYDDMCSFTIQEVVISTGWGTTLYWIFHTQALTTQATSSSYDMIDASFVKISDCPTFEVISTIKELVSTRCAVKCRIIENCKGFQYNKVSEVCILLSETAINGTLTSLYRLIE